MADIATRADIEALLRAFYRRVFDDELLGHIFLDVAHMDLEAAHLPVLGDFWEKVLFNTSEYTGNMMEVHRRIREQEPFTPGHFQRWLSLWDQTVDAHFAGSMASLAKKHAARIAAAMQRNLVTRPHPRHAAAPSAATARGAGPPTSGG